ncbi:MAG: glycosyltransferase family 39 protein [Myxococcales bacterium]|nr:glycosyltransferase family 39 protein [Myxococcales bacterium]
MTEGPSSRSRRAGSELALQVALLGALVALALAFYGDYSLTWDESVDHYRRKAGEKTWNFWFGGFAADHALWDYGHNPSTSFLYYVIWRGLSALGVTVDLVDLWHLLTALIGVTGVMLTYRLGDRLGGRWAGLLAGATLALWPIWVGQSFGNFKDVPFAVAWLWCIDSALALAEAPSSRAVVRHALAVTSLLVVRIGGLLVVPISIAALVLGLRRVDRPTRHRILATTTAMLVVALGVHAVSYPYVLLHPWDGLVDLVAANRSFEWTGETLTFGLAHSSTETPAWYVPVWFLVTLPELTLVGLAALVWSALRRASGRGALAACGATYFARRFTLATVAWPLLYVVLAGAPIYDGIRHVLFVVPPLIALASAALVGPGSALPRPVAITLTVLGLVSHGVDVVRFHPMQTAWFNRLVGGTQGAAASFTVDYWASSAKLASEWIVAQSEPTHVCVLAEIEESWQHYLRPPWRVTGAQRLSDCPPDARFVYAFARNRLIPEAREAAAASRRYVEVGRIDVGGATLGVWFQRITP